MNYYSSQFKLGILGGGQLGKMMLYDTRKFDIQTYVLDPSDEAPCKISCDKFVQGSLMDFDTVYNFGKQVDVLTFEIELVNVDALEKLEQEGIKVFPSSKTLRIIQNKGKQKQFYKDNNLPTSDFKLFENLQNLKSSIVIPESSSPSVWNSPKSACNEYAVKVIRKMENLEVLPNGHCIPKKCIDFKMK